MKKYVFVFAILCSYGYTLWSQTAIERKIDSMSVVAASSSDSLRLSIYNQIAFYYVFNDSIKADSLLRLGIEDAQRSKNPYAESVFTNTFGILNAVHQEYDSAAIYYNRSLEISRKHDFKELESRAMNNTGMSAWNNGKLSEALAYFFQALELTEAHFPDANTSVYTSNIGLIYQELEEIDNALLYHERALSERRERGIEVEQIISLNNIGICHRLNGNFEKAISSYKAGIAQSLKTNSYSDYQSLHNNIGNVLVELRRYPEAIDAYHVGIDTPPSGPLDPYAYHVGLSALANVFILNNQPKAAAEYAEKALANIVTATDLNSKSETLYKAASLIEAGRGNHEQASVYLDSLKSLFIKKFSDENATALADFGTKYETAIKEAALAETRASLAEREIEVKQKNNMIFGSIGVALILGLLGYLFFNQQRLKNRQQAKEYELKNALVKIETQNKLQEQRLRISRDLHDNIGSQLTFITSSLDNLKYGLKDADTKVGAKITEIGIFTKSTINELRDTIWAMNKESIDLDDLEGRIGNLLEQARSVSPEIQFSLSFDKTIDRSYAFTSVEGVNIYRIIQESVNNALKYADAEEIHLEMFQEKGDIITVIKDNGKGFEAGTEALGNGLRNMKKRAIDIGAKLDISSNVGKGTCVTVAVPTA